MPRNAEVRVEQEPVANDEHLSLLRQGVAEWNSWREHDPDNTPNLEKANIGGAKLSGANLAGANLERADLRGANQARDGVSLLLQRSP
jgi:uncharacterized protein YjbI with pentapeptide repeats